MINITEPSGLTYIKFNHSLIKMIINRFCRKKYNMITILAKKLNHWATFTIKKFSISVKNRT